MNTSLSLWSVALSNMRKMDECMWCIEDLLCCKRRRISQQTTSSLVRALNIIKRKLSLFLFLQAVLGKGQWSLVMSFSMTCLIFFISFYWFLQQNWQPLTMEKKYCLILSIPGWCLDFGNTHWLPVSFRLVAGTHLMLSSALLMCQTVWDADFLGYINLKHFVLQTHPWAHFSVGTLCFIQSCRQCFCAHPGS